MNQSLYSLETYSAIIDAFIAQEWRVIPSHKAFQIQDDALYLRHDVDYSLPTAVRLAERNHALGVAGCFYVLLRGPVYNPLSLESLKALEQLVAHEQFVGLHFDAGGILSTDLDLVTDALMSDVRTLQGMFPQAVSSVSWHNPSLCSEAFRQKMAQAIPSVVNVNALEVVGVRYLSDSNHRYTVEEWIDFANTSRHPLQVLFHPFQWVLESSSMASALAQVWKQVIRERETLFRTNHVYRRTWPQGISEDALDALLSVDRSAAT